MKGFAKNSKEYKALKTPMETINNNYRLAILKADWENKEITFHYWIEISQDSWIEVSEFPESPKQYDNWRKAHNEIQGKDGVYRVTTATRWLKLKGNPCHIISMINGG